jgi:hypothetical protein
MDDDMANGQLAPKRRSSAAQSLPPPDDFDKMISAVMQFLNATRVDRIVYLVISAISFVALISVLLWGFSIGRPTIPLRSIGSARIQSHLLRPQLLALSFEDLFDSHDENIA